MILGNRLTRFFAGYFLKQLHIKNNFLVRMHCVQYYPEIVDNQRINKHTYLENRVKRTANK